jgi:LmbE family N-acetylglucosaminyl deacetylase
VGVTRRLAAVFAHPDDDAFGVFGSIALHLDDGIEVLTVLATRGEAGPIADPSLATPENLGTVREAEARSAYAALGVPDVQLHFLGYPDGGVADIDRDEAVARTADLLAEFRPDVVVGFGPEGVTKHDDHVAMHHVATGAFHAARERAEDGFRRLLYVGIPQTEIELFQDFQREAGMEPFNPEDPFAPRGVPDETIGASVDCSAVWRKKYDALREHRTQAEELEGFPDAALPLVFGREHFVIGWPERAPGSERLGDVFEGLDAG